MNRKKLVLVALALALCIGIVSAALLSYFGLILVTTDLKQAVLVDGKSYPDSIIGETAIVSGGESFYKYHWLTSQTSVPVTLTLATLVEVGITVKYHAMGTSTTWHALTVHDGEVAEADITKTDKADSVEFKVKIISENMQHHVYGMGIAISTDVSTIDFQVWYAEAGNIPSPYTENDWYYQEYPWTNPAVLLADSGTGITATGRGAPSPGEKVFTVKIPIGLLGGCGAEYYYAMQFRTNLCCTYPLIYNLWGQTNAGSFAVATVGTPIATSFTLQSGETLPSMTASFTLQPWETLPFYIGYSFAPLIKAGTYDIYTNTTVTPTS